MPPEGASQVGAHPYRNRKNGLDLVQVATDRQWWEEQNISEIIQSMVNFRETYPFKTIKMLLQTWLACVPMRIDYFWNTYFYVPSLGQSSLGSIGPSCQQIILRYVSGQLQLHPILSSVTLPSSPIKSSTWELLGVRIVILTFADSDTKPHYTHTYSLTHSPIKPSLVNKEFRIKDQTVVHWPLQPSAQERHYTKSKESFTSCF
jgi:hypothetical protein